MSAGRCSGGRGAITVSAAARIRAPLRKFVNRGSVDAGEPSSRRNEVGNSSRLNRLAPRHA